MSRASLRGRGYAEMKADVKGGICHPALCEAKYYQPL